MAGKKHTEQRLSTLELLTFGQQDWAGGAIKPQCKHEQRFCQPTGELWSRGCLLEESSLRWKWLGPLTSPLLSHLLVDHKRNVIWVVTTPHEECGLR